MPSGEVQIWFPIVDAQGSAHVTGPVLEHVVGLYFDSVTSVAHRFICDFDPVAPGTYTNQQLIEGGAIPWTRNLWFPWHADSFWIIQNALATIGGGVLPTVYCFRSDPLVRPGS